MKVKKLIKKLSKMDPDSRIVLTGSYGSQTDQIGVEQIPEENVEDFFQDSTYKKTDKIVVIHSDISSG